MILRKTSIFPASREAVYDRLRRLKTLQYISAPYASFTPIAPNKAYTWREVAVSSYYFKLFGIIPLGRHTIKIEHFDQNYIQSRESWQPDRQQLSDPVQSRLYSDRHRICRRVSAFYEDAEKESYPAERNPIHIPDART